MINVDRNPSYPKAISELKRMGRIVSLLSLSPHPGLEQHTGARPPIRETTSPSKPRIPGVSLSVTNASGNRSDEYDAQAAGKVDTEGDIASQGMFVDDILGLTRR